MLFRSRIVALEGGGGGSDAQSMGTVSQGDVPVTATSPVPSDPEELGRRVALQATSPEQLSLRSHPNVNGVDNRTEVDPMLAGVSAIVVPALFEAFAKIGELTEHAVLSSGGGSDSVDG